MRSSLRAAAIALALAAVELAVLGACAARGKGAASAPSAAVTSSTAGSNTSGPHRTASDGSETTPANSAASPKQSLGEQLSALLFEQERAGWLEGRTEGYLALFSANARIVAQRGPKPGVHDVTFAVPSYRVLMHYQFRQVPSAALTTAFGAATLSFEGARWQFDAGRWHLVHVRKFGSLVRESVQEQVVFALEQGRWRIVSLVYHPLTATSGGDTLFASEQLSELDAKVDAASPDPEKRAAALLGALRFAEAAQLLATLAGAPHADASAWVEYGYAALFAGDAAAGERAFARARELDPLVTLPEPPAR